MAKDRSTEDRMAGMLYAYNLAKEKGLEELEKDIRKRNYLKIPLQMKQEYYEKVIQQLSSNVYNMMLTAILFMLHDTFGFGRVRIKRAKEAFDELIQSTTDLDYMSCHYVTMTDYAKELNDSYDIGIDLTKVQNLQRVYDEDNECYRMCRIDKVMEVMREAGYSEAADFLNSKLID